MFYRKFSPRYLATIVVCLIFTLGSLGALFLIYLFNEARLPLIPYSAASTSTSSSSSPPASSTLNVATTAQLPPQQSASPSPSIEPPVAPTKLAPPRLALLNAHADDDDDDEDDDEGDERGLLLERASVEERRGDVGTIARVRAHKTLMEGEVGNGGMLNIDEEEQQQKNSFQLQQMLGAMLDKRRPDSVELSLSGVAAKGMKGTDDGEDEDADVDDEDDNDDDERDLSDYDISISAEMWLPHAPSGRRRAAAAGASSPQDNMPESGYDTIYIDDFERPAATPPSGPGASQKTGKKFKTHKSKNKSQKPQQPPVMIRRVLPVYYLNMAAYSGGKRHHSNAAPPSALVSVDDEGGDDDDVEVDDEDLDDAGNVMRAADAYYVGGSGSGAGELETVDDFNAQRDAEETAEFIKRIQHKLRQAAKANGQRQRKQMRKHQQQKKKQKQQLGLKSNSKNTNSSTVAINALDAIGFYKLSSELVSNLSAPQLYQDEQFVVSSLHQTAENNNTSNRNSTVPPSTKPHKRFKGLTAPQSLAVNVAAAVKTPELTVTSAPLDFVAAPAPAAVIDSKRHQGVDSDHSSALATSAAWLETRTRRIIGNVKKSEERSRQLLLCEEAGVGELCRMLFKGHLNE